MNILKIDIKDKNHFLKHYTYVFQTDKSQNEIFTNDNNDTLRCGYKFNPDFLSFCYKNMHWLWEAYLINGTIEKMEFIDTSNIKELGY
jgi:hypothetical protein